MFAHLPASLVVGSLFLLGCLFSARLVIYLLACLVSAFDTQSDLVPWARALPASQLQVIVLNVQSRLFTAAMSGHHSRVTAVQFSPFSKSNHQLISGYAYPSADASKFFFADGSGTPAPVCARPPSRPLLPCPIVVLMCTIVVYVHN